MKRTMPSSRSLKIARHRLVHDFIMETVGRRIAGRGFVLKPYYVIREGLFDGRSGEFALGSPG